MNTITLKFGTKADLLNFYTRSENAQFTIDLEELTLTSSFSESDVVVAIKNYNARLQMEEAVY